MKTIKTIVEKIIAKGASMTTISTFNNPEVFDLLSQYNNDIRLLGVTSLTSWSPVEELNLYTAWNIDTKSDSWQCIFVEDATTWAELEAKRTYHLTMNEQQHNDMKTLMEE